MFRKPHLACPRKVGSKDQSSKFVPDEAGLGISDGELDLWQTLTGCQGNSSGMGSAQGRSATPATTWRDSQLFPHGLVLLTWMPVSMNYWLNLLVNVAYQRVVEQYFPQAGAWLWAPLWKRLRSADNTHRGCVISEAVLPWFRCSPMNLALEQQNLTVTVWTVSPLVSSIHASSLSKLKMYSSSSLFVHLSRYCLQLYQYFQPSPPIYQLLPQLFPYFLLRHSLYSWCELPDFFHQALSLCIFRLS